MTRRAIAAMLCLLLAVTTAAGPEPGAPSVRFMPVQVVVETGTRPLAAYQISIETDRGDVRIVGIEGGTPGSVFTEPPYYDTRAMQRDHVIIADFSTAPRETLPTGRVRVATVHVQVTGDEAPAFRGKLTVAADHEGAAVDAKLLLITGDDR